MSSVLQQLDTKRWVRRLGCLALLTLGLGLAGCCSMPDTRGEGYNDEYTRSMRDVRRPDRDIKVWGFSNKARDIERDFGAQ